MIALIYKLKKHYKFSAPDKVAALDFVLKCFPVSNAKYRVLEFLATRKSPVLNKIITNVLDNVLPKHIEKALFKLNNKKIKWISAGKRSGWVLALKNSGRAPMPKAAPEPPKKK